jgi:hypothetical protein
MGEERRRRRQAQALGRVELCFRDAQPALTVIERVNAVVGCTIMGAVLNLF